MVIEQHVHHPIWLLVIFRFSSRCDRLATCNYFKPMIYEESVFCLVWCEFCMHSSSSSSNIRLFCFWGTTALVCLVNFVWFLTQRCLFSWCLNSELKNVLSLLREFHLSHSATTRIGKLRQKFCLTLFCFGESVLSLVFYLVLCSILLYIFYVTPLLPVPKPEWKRRRVKTTQSILENLKKSVFNLTWENFRQHFYMNFFNFYSYCLFCLILFCFGESILSLVFFYLVLCSILLYIFYVTPPMPVPSPEWKRRRVKKHIILENLKSRLFSLTWDTSDTISANLCQKPTLRTFKIDENRRFLRLKPTKIDASYVLKTTKTDASYVLKPTLLKFWNRRFSFFETNAS